MPAVSLIKKLATVSLLILAFNSPLMAAETGRGGELFTDLGTPGLEANPNSNCFTAWGGLGCDDFECEATVCAVDPFCCETAWDSICQGEAIDMCEIDGNLEGDVARFTVYKQFADGDPEDENGDPLPVEVMLTCFTGLPLEQSFMITEDRGVVFVVTNYVDGELNCQVSEMVPDGYSVTYAGGDTNTDEGCFWENLPLGAGRVCNIENNVLPVEVEVVSVWDFDGTEVDVPEVATGYLDCQNTANGFTSTSWGIFGDGTFTYPVYPSVDGPATTCTVSYDAVATEVEASGCESTLVIEVGGSTESCTITFTVFFEGIPTINQYGLAVLVMLMLGVGFVGFRRLI